MSTAKLPRILRFRMGSHLLPIEQGRHLRLPRHRRVCRLCHTGALGDERHMLLVCPALADLRDDFSPVIAECSGVMARLVWARNQPMVSRYIIACLDRKEGRKFTHPWQPTRLNGWNSVCASIQPSWLPSMSNFPSFLPIKASDDVPADHGLISGPHKPSPDT